MTDRRKYLYSDITSSGKTRYRFWRGRGHRKITIHGLQGERAFEDRYTELLNGGDGVEDEKQSKVAGSSKYTSGTVDAALEQYLLSRAEQNWAIRAA